MAAEPNDLTGTAEPAPPEAKSRGRRFGRLFLMAAGGLAAPCLALAAFFLSSSGGSDAPAAKSSIQGGRVTTPTTAANGKPSAPRVTTTTTTIPAPPSVPPARDPFAPLVSQAPTGGAAKG